MCVCVCVCVSQVQHNIDRLKEEHLHLNQHITMYNAAGSTPGSTPSSSVVNINDVGQLPIELHVPHINEPDAISARATVSINQWVLYNMGQTWVRLMCPE